MRDAKFRSVVVALALCAALAPLAGCTVGSTSGQGPAGYVAPATRIVADVAYGTLPAQRLDVHLPTTGSGPFPVIVYFHSGGWIAGAKTDIPEIIRTLVPDTGAALVSVEYRLTARDDDREEGDAEFENTFPAAHQDADQAIRFVRANAARWNLNPGMIVVAGASAGATLASMAGAVPGRYVNPDLPADLVAVSPVVQGVLSYVGVTDFAAFLQAGGWAPWLTGAYLGCPGGDATRCDPALLREASVLFQLGAGLPPAYFACGLEDPLVNAGTQCVPVALWWAYDRGDLNQPVPWLRGTYLELEANAGHNFDVSNSNYRAMEGWVRSVFNGALR